MMASSLTSYIFSGLISGSGFARQKRIGDETGKNI
jgi:hypothetical protein